MAKGRQAAEKVQEKEDKEAQYAGTAMSTDTRSGNVLMQAIATYVSSTDTSSTNVNGDIAHHVNSTGTDGTNARQ